MLRFFSKKWHLGVYILFFWLLFGDTIRKLVPGQPATLILVGDFILFITYLSFVAWSVVEKKGFWKPPFFATLSLFTAFVIFEAFNPASPGFLVGLVGLRNFIWFIPLMFLGYSFFQNKKRSRKILKGFVYLAIPFFVFAVIQLSINSDLLIFKNFEGAHQVHAFALGGIDVVEKIPSFFGSDQRYGMISMLWFLLGLGLYRGRNKVLFISILSALGGVIISGSRSAFVLTFLGLILFFLFMRKEAIKRHIGQALRFFSLQRLIVSTGTILVLLFVLYLFGIGTGIQNLVAFLNVFNSRIPEFFSQDLPSAIRGATLLGHGTGTLSQGLAEVGELKGTLKEAASSGGETGVKRILFELGIIGFFVFYFFWAKVLLAMRQAREKVLDFEVRKLLLSIFLFLVLILIRFTFVHHQVLGDSVVLASIWFFAGIFFKLTRGNEDTAHNSHVLPRS